MLFKISNSGDEKLKKFRGLPVAIVQMRRHGSTSKHNNFGYGPRPISF